MKLNVFLAGFFYLLLFNACKPKPHNYEDWRVYGGSKENIRYSALHQIDTNNVSELIPVWEFHTLDTGFMTQLQFNPIVVGNSLFAISPKLKLFSIDAVTGKQQWVFDPYQVNNKEVMGMGYFAMNVCRGITYYADDESKRLFYAAGSSLFCINALTGKPITSFGREGRIDLHNDLGRDVKDLYIAMTSPGIIYKDMIIIGTRVAEEAAAAPGYIRAYDVHTGKLRWIFHTIPQPGEPGFESWDDQEAWKHVGGANAWAGFSMDEEKGIVYAPVGSAVNKHNHL